MLGSVAFDGLSRSTWWFERLYDVEIRFSDPLSAERAVQLLNLSALTILVVIVATIYTLSVKVAEGVVGRARGLPGIFVGSLIPIAIVYALSHYLSYLLVSGQFVHPAALRSLRARAGTCSGRPASSRISLCSSRTRRGTRR